MGINFSLKSSEILGALNVSSVGFSDDAMLKNLPTSAGDGGFVGLIPVSGRSFGGGHGNPPKYSCLGNPMDRGAWQAMVHKVTKS